jgi:hypothetical protein
MTDNELPTLYPAEVRILGCLIEKKELTPDVYPLSLNAAVAAANQKTGREPVMELDQGEVLRALKLLQEKRLVRQAFASRVERYEHLLAQAYSLTQGQIVILGLLMLRGPQTAHELLARSERMARFSSIDQLRTELDLLIGRKPPLVQLIERGPGQREDRYAQLFGGPVEQAAPADRDRPSSTADRALLEERVDELERRVAALEARLAAGGRE